MKSPVVVKNKEVICNLEKMKEGKIYHFKTESDGTQSVVYKNGVITYNFLEVSA